MQLTVGMMLRRAEAMGPHAALVGITPGGRLRETWPGLASRARRVAAALPSLGVRPGDRVGTFAWNGLRHLELFFGVPASGAVLQPLNVRLFPEQIAWIAAHAGDRVVFVDAALTAQLAPLRPMLTGVETYVVLPDGTEPHPDFADAVDYEALLASVPDTEPSDVDERAAACLCYTSGTTGKPKGVVYSHRSLTLHAMSGCFVDSFAVAERDTVLPLTPLFHATSWGLPYSAALAGAGLVLAGHDTSAPAVVELIRRERVTLAAGVPTFWLAVDQVAGDDLGTLRRILCGGSAIPPALIRQYHRRGVTVQQGWGMTEMSPSGSLTLVRRHLDDRPEEERLALHSTQGVVTAGVELRIVDPAGEVIRDGVGEIEVRGPWVTAAYLRPDDDSNESRFHDGWLRTGDVGTVDGDGYLHLLDRAKDLIKSGGEWISSIELENHLMAHAGVAQAMVIAIPDPHWAERPAALVVRSERGPEVTAEELRAHLRERVAKWMVPESVEFVAALPTTGTGKFDKKAARAAWRKRSEEEQV
ncbi:long-chain-fatty-acid--CoA ligase [Virgisporangium aliadipatigenens]|nr:long-chain-fatty-acid--CoA ligase [Virgisporangium aliadipatigenens]